LDADAANDWNEIGSKTVPERAGSGELTLQRGKVLAAKGCKAGQTCRPI